MNKQSNIKQENYLFNEKDYYSTSKEEDGWLMNKRTYQSIRHNCILYFFQKHYNAKQQNSVLDIGCGFGDFTKKLVSQFPELSITGTDISNVAISGIKSNIPKGNFIQAKLPNLPFSDNSFDIIFLNAVLNYLPHSQQIESLKNIKQLLKPNGLLLFYTPLDDGTKYFTIPSSKTVIETHFKIKDTSYIYGLLPSLIERPFYRFILRYKLIKEKKHSPNFNSIPNSIVTRLNPKRLLLKAITDISIFRFLFLIIFFPFYKVSYSVISCNFFFKALYVISKKCFPSLTKTGLMYLCEN